MEHIGSLLVLIVDMHEAKHADIECSFWTLNTDILYTMNTSLVGQQTNSRCKKAQAGPLEWLSLQQSGGGQEPEKEKKEL